MTSTKITPLVVDLDGTLAATDLAWEGVIRVALERPSKLPAAAAALLHGRAAFKAVLAEAVELDTSGIPLRASVERLVADARMEGRPVILATAAHESLARAIAARVGADRVLASDAERNLKGQAKLEAVREVAEVFDYAGNGAADLPLLRAARKAYLVDSGPVLRWRAGAVGREAERLDRDVAGGVLSWLKALRPHQWTKNLLLLLPVLAAPMTWTADLVLRLVGGLAAFCLVASALYLLNDLADLPHDRRHPDRRSRPLAAGGLSIPAALATIVLFVGAAAALALSLPAEFARLLAAYAVLNVSYSVWLKRRLIVDVVLLAGLYTIRIVAGAALAEIPLTGWFLAFSVFLFLSLGVLKRCSALVATEGEDAATRTAEEDPGASWRRSLTLPGRAYLMTDLPMLRSAGLGSGLVAGLVYCLYIAGPVSSVYGHPQLLWVGLPLYLYWIVRIWVLAGRNAVREDPVLFVLRDRPSYLVALSFLFVVYLAR